MSYWQRKVRSEPLPPDVRAMIIAAWMRGGMLPAQRQSTDGAGQPLELRA